MTLLDQVRLTFLKVIYYIYIKSEHRTDERLQVISPIRITKFNANYRKTLSRKQYQTFHSDNM